MSVNAVNIYINNYYNPTQTVADNLRNLIQSGDYVGAAAGFLHYLEDHTLDQGWNLLTLIKAFQAVSSFQEEACDELWMLLGRRYIALGLFQQVEKILVEDYGTSNYRLYRHHSSTVLLSDLLKAYCNLGAVVSITQLLDRFPKTAMGLDKEELIDDAVEEAATLFLEQGDIDAAIELSKSMSTPFDQAELLFLFVKKALEERKIEQAKLIANSIPDALVLTHIRPRRILNTLPQSYYRTSALSLIDKYQTEEHLDR